MLVTLYFLQVNEKGESPLHTACIDGNFKRVKALIDQVGENCGKARVHSKDGLLLSRSHVLLVEELLVFHTAS